MSLIKELIANMAHSSEQGFLGVPAIYIYLVIIVATAFYRIRQFNKEGH